jgi:hypothetical protein
VGVAIASLRRDGDGDGKGAGEDFSFVCSCCGTRHGMPYAFAFDKPLPWSESLLSDPTSSITPDLCVIEGRDFFVRGVVRIPILDGPEPSFEWGVWASLSENSYRRTVELEHSPLGQEEPPYFGWLCNELAPFYPSTLGLKTHVHTQAIGLRPLIEVEPTDHPLAVEQREGVSFERVREIAQQILHPAQRVDNVVETGRNRLPAGGADGKEPNRKRGKNPFRRMCG